MPEQISGQISATDTAVHRSGLSHSSRPLHHSHNSSDAPLRESAAWRQEVALLQSYKQGKGQAPPPLRINASASAVPSLRANLPPDKTIPANRDNTLPLKRANTAPTDWENITRLAGNKYGVDPALIQAVLQIESNFNPVAVSSKGALGAMQLMPDTGHKLGLTDFFDPVANIDAGTRYLAAMLRDFQSLELSLAAYNAGPDAVRRYGDIPPYAETRAYVSRVLDAYKKLSFSNSERNALMP